MTVGELVLPRLPMPHAGAETSEVDVEWIAVLKSLGIWDAEVLEGELNDNPYCGGFIGEVGNDGGLLPENIAYMPGKRVRVIVLKEEE